MLIVAAMIALTTGSPKQEAAWSYPELLRHFHVAAYATGMCSSDEVALYTFNATGRHPSRAATTMSTLNYSIVGFREGEVIALEADQDQLLAAEFPAGQESIKCVKSAARSQGATHFAVRVNNVRIHDVR